MGAAARPLFSGWGGGAGAVGDVVAGSGAGAAGPGPVRGLVSVYFLQHFFRRPFGLALPFFFGEIGLLGGRLSVLLLSVLC